MKYSTRVHALAKITVGLAVVSFTLSFGGLVLGVKAIGVLGALAVAATLIAANIWYDVAASELRRHQQ